MLDLFAYREPGFHALIRVWHYTAPVVAILLVGMMCSSVWRVCFQPRARMLTPASPCCVARPDGGVWERADDG